MLKTVVLNILHLPERTDREKTCQQQMYIQKIPARIWFGFKAPLPNTAICKSHKQIVEFAKNTGQKTITIAEDDIKFTSKKSWKTYIEKIPDDFDIYLGGISGGEISEQTNDLIPGVGWSGLFLYTVHSRFYDAFLAADETKNLDRWLSGTGLEQIEKILGRKPVYKVCYPIIAITFDGYSDNSCKEEKYQIFNAYEKLS